MYLQRPPATATPVSVHVWCVAILHLAGAWCAASWAAREASFAPCSRAHLAVASACTW
jgi:hypothetical protein